MLFSRGLIFPAGIFLIYCVFGHYSLDNMVAITPKESKKHDKLTAEELSLLHTTAKDISHSKGGMSENEEELKGIHHELRRSVIRKATIQSELDNLEALLSDFQNNISDKISLLQDMKDLVHQYDAGVSLVTMGGLELLLSHLSSSDENIVSSVLSVLGAAMQGNPHVQKAAFQKEIGLHLRNILSESPNLYSRGMIVLSGLLRNLPEAQKEFFANNGALILANILQSHVISTDTKLKIVNLLSDLATEHEMTKQYSKNSEDQDDDKTFLYRLFRNEIKKYHICNLIPQLLDLADFDTHQKVVEAMNSLKPICLEDFQTKEIQLSLAALLTHYDPAGVMNYPLFPLIDPELKEMLFQELKILYSIITPERLNENVIYNKKTEL